MLMQYIQDLRIYQMMWHWWVILILCMPLWIFCEKWQEMGKYEYFLGNCKIVIPCNIVSMQYTIFLSSLKYLKTIIPFNNICSGIFFWQNTNSLGYCRIVPTHDIVLQYHWHLWGLLIHFNSAEGHVQQRKQHNITKIQQSKL